MFNCSNLPIFKYSNVQIQYSNVPRFKFSNIQMFKYSNVQIFKCSKVQMFKCLNVQMSKVKCQISIRLNFCWSVPLEFLRSFYLAGKTLSFAHGSILILMRGSICNVSTKSSAYNPVGLEQSLLVCMEIYLQHLLGVLATTPWAWSSSHWRRWRPGFSRSSIYNVTLLRSLDWLYTSLLQCYTFKYMYGTLVKYL